MNNLKSYTEYTVSTPTTDFVVGFEFNEDLQDINVTVDDVDAEEAGYTVILSNPTTVTLSPAVTTGVVRLMRETNIDNSDYNFTQGAIFRAPQVDQNYQQIRHSQQEVRDSFIKLANTVYPFVDTLEETLQAAQDAADAANTASTAADNAASMATDAALAAEEAAIAAASKIGYVDTIADLQDYASLVDGMCIIVKSYHTPTFLVINRPYRGGGTFVWKADSTITPNGGTVFGSNTVGTGRWIRLGYSTIDVTMFGAKGDSSYDDRPAFQNAIDFLRSEKGGELFVPTPPQEYRWKSYDVANSACLVIQSPISSIYIDPITIRAEGNLCPIKVDLGTGVLIEAAVLLKGGGLYKKMENLSIWGGATSTNKNCRYVVKASDAYYPNLTFRDCQFYVATEDCLKISTYVTVMDKVQTAYSKRGMVINKTDPMVAAGVSGPVTSITMNSCYGLNHDYHAYWFGETTYCTLVSCAADHIINNLGDGYEAYPYYFDIARGVTMVGCGAESSTRILRARVSQGLVIKGFSTLSIGSNTLNPNALIRLEGGESAEIGGLWLQNPQAFNYILQVGATFGAESVTITDQSIDPSEITYTSNFRFENPVRFLLRDFSRKTQDNTLVNTGNAATNAANLSTLAQLAWDTEMLHDNIIRLPSGDFPISSTVYLANAKTRGSGRVRLVGHADGTSRLVLQGAGGISFGVPNQLAEVQGTLENVNVYLSATLDASNKGITFQKSNVMFTNAKITSDNGSRQYAGVFGAKVTLDANSYIATSLFGTLEVNYSYKASTPPTSSTRLPVGTRFNASDPNATRIGWLNTTDNGATWLALTP